MNHKKDPETACWDTCSALLRDKLCVPLFSEYLTLKSCTAQQGPLEWTSMAAIAKN